MSFMIQAPGSLYVYNIAAFYRMSTKRGTADSLRLEPEVYLMWRRDTQHNDIQHNDTQHKKLISDTQHNDTQCNYT